MVASAWFTNVEQVEIERRVSVTAEELIGHLSTISAYLILPTDERTAALEAIRAVLPDHLDLVADLTLHLAQRTAHDTAPP